MQEGKEGGGDSAMEDGEPMWVRLKSRLSGGNPSTAAKLAECRRRIVSMRIVAWDSHGGRVFRKIKIRRGENGSKRASARFWRSQRNFRFEFASPTANKELKEKPATSKCTPPIFSLMPKKKTAAIFHAKVSVTRPYEATGGETSLSGYVAKR